MPRLKPGDLQVGVTYEGGTGGVTRTVLQLIPNQWPRNHLGVQFQEHRDGEDRGVHQIMAASFINWCGTNGNGRARKGGFTDKRARGSHPLPRFIAKVSFEDGPLDTQCWLWTASQKTNGYGQFAPYGPRPVLSHVWSYRFFRKREIPLGFDLDHLCRERLCVNPDHLELVTHQENSARRGYAQRGIDVVRGAPFGRHIEWRGVEEWEERAAILEYEGHYERHVAEELATQEMENAQAGDGVGTDSWAGDDAPF